MVKKAKGKVKTVVTKGLTLRVPENDSGLLVPVELNDDKEDFTPLDFTSLSSREIGRQHSAWAVRHSYALYLLGNLRAEIGNIKHDIKREEMRFSAKHKDKHKTKYALVAAQSRSKRLVALRDRLAKGEHSEAILGAQVDSYEALRNAASRELSRRQAETAPKY